MKKVIFGTVLLAVAVAAGIVGTPVSTNITAVNTDKESVVINIKGEEAVKFLPLHTEGRAEFPLMGERMAGKINIVQVDLNNVTRVAGEVPNGTFCFSLDENGDTTGIVVVAGTTYTMATLKGMPTVWVKREAGEIACKELPPVGSGAAAVTTGSLTTQAAVPVWHSKAGSKVVLLLDFIGGPVQDPLWMGGKSFVAAPAGYTVAQAKTVFDVVAERYAAFNVDVTTEYKTYANAPVKSRMRVLLTATNVVAGYSGYAYIGSLRNAGSGCYSATVPAFVFTNMVGNAKNAGEVAAHELGHTFGLTHDGTKSREYYSGQNNWAPVMGTTYSKAVIQWSKGEYASANNKQDDLATIASVPGVGFSTASNMAAPTIVGGTMFAVTDVVSNSAVARYFNVVTNKSGVLTLSVNVTNYGALNTIVEVYSNGLLVTKSDLANSLNNTIALAVKAGTYVVKVYGAGDLDPLTNGYSSYGSIGSFALSGTLK